jgi:uncharacterized iron-regulated membrane protein
MRRKRLWQLHSWMGLIAGLGLLVIGVTGSLLVFRQEIEMLVHRDLVSITPAPAGRLSFDALLDRAQEQLPEHEVAGWEIQYNAPQRADLLWVIRRGTTDWQIATLDPYTGRVLATPRDATSTLTGWLLELHYAFFADHAGLLITGMFAVLLCALGVTGIWIYRKFWKLFFTLRWSASARIFFADAHKMVGITSVAFNLLLGFTGAYWNLTHVISEELAGTPEPPPLERRLYAENISLDALASDAAQRLPGFHIGYISLPTAPEAGVTLWGAVEPRGLLRGPYGCSVFYDEKTGAHKATTDVRTAGAWTQIVDAFTPLHFGTFGGLPVKILWCLGGLTPGMLAITGSLVWWHRRNSRHAGGRVSLHTEAEAAADEAHRTTGSLDRTLS